MSCRILSIDPGNFGAMAWVTYSDGEPVDGGACPLPFRMVGHEPVSRVDIENLTYRLSRLARSYVAIVEEPLIAVGNMAKSARTLKTTLENYGRILGAIEAGLTIDYITVRPTTWKRYFGLTFDKAASVRLARERFPFCANLLDIDGLNPSQKAHKIADGMAEALLIGLYGVKCLMLT